MPTFKIKYTYTEEGSGYSYVKANTLAEAQELAEKGDFEHDHEAIEDSYTTVKLVKEVKKKD
jgi:exonuclease I